VRALLAASPELADVTGAYHKTPLHLAAEKDHREVAEALLAAGARLETETTWGMTPLEWAANMNSQEVGRALINGGAHLHLWAAAGLGLAEAVEGFFTPDAGEGNGSLRPAAFKPEHRQQLDGSWADDPDDYDEAGLISDSFYIACRNGHTEVARFLLGKGADVDHRGFWGATGLHWAAANGHLDTVRFLLENGARTDLLDEQHQATPHRWAAEFDHREVMALLPG
jgi:ankyrin repeat protein